MSETETSSQRNSPSEKKKVEKSTEEETTPRAKTPTTPTSNSNWWGSFISQAKEKSASVLEAVKNDLNEITTAVTETLQLVPSEEEEQQQQQAQSDSSPSDHQSTVNFANMKQSISSSISTFFGSVTDALIPQLDEEDVSEAVLITNDDTVVLTGFTKFLAELQASDETYLEEPSKTAELSEKYRMWLEIVEQDQFTQQRVDKMLEQSAILNEKYNKFVPDTVSHMNFFKRYLFKKALLEDELANEERRRKEAQMVISKQPEAIVEEKPVTPPSTVPEVAPQKSSPRKSEMSDLDIANFEISEEEQARLLAEYEREIKEREKNKTDDIVIPDIIDDDDEVAVKPKEKAVKVAGTGGKKSVNFKSTAASASKGKNNNKDSKSLPPPQQQKSNQQQKRGGQEKEKSKGKKDSSELPMQKDHFKKESESSTSDESWEKDFDI